MECRLQNKYFVRRKTIWPNRLIQFDLFQKLTINDILNENTCSPSLIIQIIYPTITPITISRILHSFDLDICSIALHNRKVIMSFSCLQALNSGHTTCYATPIVPSQFMRKVLRFSKYQRKGFNVLFPKEFNISTFCNTNIENCNETQPEKTYRFRRAQFGENCDSFKMQKTFCEYYKFI